MFDSLAYPKRIPCKKGCCYLTSNQNPGYLVDITGLYYWDYTTELYGDYNKQ